MHVWTESPCSPSWHVEQKWKWRQPVDLASGITRNCLSLKFTVWVWTLKEWPEPECDYEGHTVPQGMKRTAAEKFLARNFSKDFWPRNNKLSQVTVYLFLGPKWAAVLITNLKKTLDVDGTRFDNYSFSRIGIIGLWFESWLAPSINKRPGHRCETFGFWMASGEPSAFGNKVLCKGNRWLGWLPKIKTAGFWEGKNQRYFFLS